MIEKIKKISPSIYVYGLISLIFIICYACAGALSYIGDFTQDYPLIHSFIEDGVNFKNLFYSRGIESSLIYNLLVLMNVKAFNLSFAFVKVINFFVSFGLFTLTYFLFLKKKDKGIYNIVVTALFSIILINFYSVFEFSSQTLTKFSLISMVGTYLLLDRAFSASKDLHKYLYLSGALLLGIFAYSLILIPVCAYFFTKVSKLEKKDKIIYISSLSIIILLPLLLNHQVLSFIGSELELKERLINVLNSLFVPNIIYHPYDSYKILYLLVAAASIAFILFYFVYKIWKKQFDLPFFIYISLGISMLGGLLGYQDNPSFYSSLYVCHSFIGVILMLDIFNQVDESVKFNLYNDEPLKFSLHKAVAFLVLLVATLSQCYSFEARVIHQKKYGNVDDAIAYSINYDYFNAQEFFGTTFANCSREEYREIMSYYYEHGLANVEYTIEENKEYVSLETIKRNYGFYEIEPDFGAWTDKFFSFNYYNTTDYINLDIFSASFNSPNKIDIYINNKLVETYDLIKGSNHLFIDSSEYKNQNIVLACVVDQVHYEEVQKRNVGVKLIGLAPTDRYGFYAPEANGSNWVSDKFEFNVEVKDSLLVLNTYEIKELDNNELNIYINDELVDTYKITEGVNQVGIPTYNYKGETINVRGELSKSTYMPNDNRKLALLIDSIEQKSSYGFFEKEASGSRWAAPSFGFGYTPTKDALKLVAYQIDKNLPNTIEVFVNGQKINEYQLASGMNDVIVDLSSYKNQEIFIEFKCTNGFKSDDGRILGIIVSSLNETELEKGVNL